MFYLLVFKNVHETLRSAAVVYGSFTSIPSTYVTRRVKEARLLSQAMRYIFFSLFLHFQSLFNLYTQHMMEH